MLNVLKTWEMLKALTENPTLKFKRLRDGYEFYIDNNGALCRKPGITDAISLSDDWELVREPVDFMTAVKAFDKGKVIACKNSDFGTRHYVRRSEICLHLKDNGGLPITSEEILNGKWYIED